LNAREDRSVKLVRKEADNQVYGQGEGQVRGAEEREKKGLSIVIPLVRKSPAQVNVDEVNLLLPKEIFEIPLWKSLLRGTQAVFFPTKQPPLVLTSRPLDCGELLGDRLEHSWYRLIFTNLRDGLFPAKQPPLQLISKPVEGQNEVYDALALPWYKSIIGNIRDKLFPRKLPPLELTSNPIPVAELWGFYSYKRGGALTSIAVHALLIALVIGATFLEPHRSADEPKAHAFVIPLLHDDDKLVLPSLKEIGGGGGGGDEDVLPGTKGDLPKPTMQQFTPPIVVTRNATPRVPMEPGVVVPPDIKLPPGKVPNVGDPMAKILRGPHSNGTGSGGGIGSGSGGGVGSGHGSGVGPGSGGGIGGGVFRVGGGVSPPRPIYRPEPEFSDEARKVKHQGIVMLQLVVDADGLPRNIQISRALGMGLDEKAIETVGTWRFEPARKNGQPVPVLINVEVDFSMH
jgi:TonB family protein